jgi:hypothetical protein
MATKILISELSPYFLDLDAPTLGAKEFEEDGVKVWLVWCKYCRRWHVHGPGEGHRLAHCKQRTPYTATGYNLARIEV